MHSRLDDSSLIVPLPDGAAGFLIAAPDRFRLGYFTTAGLRISDLEGGENSTLPIDPERRRQLSVTQTRLGLRIAVWVDNTEFDLLDAAGRIVCRASMSDNDAPKTVVVSPDAH